MVSHAADSDLDFVELPLQVTIGFRFDSLHLQLGGLSPDLLVHHPGELVLDFLNNSVDDPLVD